MKKAARKSVTAKKRAPRTAVKTKTPKVKAEPRAEIPANFAPLVSAFTEDRQVTVVRNFGNVGMRVCGKAFAMMVKGNLVAKLPRHRVDELLGSHSAEPFKLGQRQMKDWVSVPPRAAPWMEVAREAYDFVKREA